MNKNIIKLIIPAMLLISGSASAYPQWSPGTTSNYVEYNGWVFMRCGNYFANPPAPVLGNYCAKGDAWWGKQTLADQAIPLWEKGRGYKEGEMVRMAALGYSSDLFYRAVIDVPANSVDSNYSPKQYADNWKRRN